MDVYKFIKLQAQKKYQVCYIEKAIFWNNLYRKKAILSISKIRSLFFFYL